MADLQDNRVVQAFTDLRSAGKKTLVPFLTAGYPDVETTEALLKEVEARGVRVCEVGVPFSDPIADGPTIQASYTAALAAGIDSDQILRMVRRYRDAGGQLALVAMVSYSIVYRRGVEAYLTAAGEAGFDGIIIPDLSLEEAADVEALSASRGLANVMLIAPTTPPQRQVEIARHCRGFIYFISVAGITGERDRLPQTTIAAVADLRGHTDTPICVGFGISNPETVAAVCEVADGAIVGSAIIHRITDAKAAGPQRVVAEVGEFVSQLLQPLH